MVDTAGVLRIKSYVGKLPEPATYQEGADILRATSDNQFPKLTAADWLAAAKRAWREDGGRLVVTYDPALTRTLETVAPDKPFPTLWNEFDAMARVPLMVVHGANSDILSTATVTDMQTHRPDMEILVVPDQGHAPLLAEAPTIAAIAAFAAKCDAEHSATLNGDRGTPYPASFRGARSANPESRLRRKRQAIARVASPPGFRVPPAAAPE